MFKTNEPLSYDYTSYNIFFEPLYNEHHDNYRAEMMEFNHSNNHN